MAATIRDVAKRANVSVATVSRVLNGTAKVSDSAKDAVLKAQKELGFYLNANARTLAKKDSETIGILVSDISDAYFGSMIKSCDVVANREYYGRSATSIENKSTIEYGTEQGLAALIYGEQGVSSLPIQDITGEYIDTDNEYMYYYSAEFVK